MKYVFINRIQDVERRESMIELCKILEIEPTFFKAVDGVTELNIIDSNINNVKFILYKSHLYLHDITKFKRQIRPSYGVFGASISHQLVYEQLINDNDNDMYCIFEDDVLLVNGTNSESLKNFIENLPSPNTYDFGFFNEPRFKTEEGEQIPINDMCYKTNTVKFGGAFSYFITKRGAAKILSLYKNWILNTPDDHLCYASNTCFTDIIIPYQSIFTFNENIKRTVFRDNEQWYNSVWDIPYHSELFPNYDDLISNFNTTLLY